MCHRIVQGGDTLNIIRMIFNACTSILRESINLFGYDISLMQVIMYGFVLFLLFKIVREFIL